MNKEKHPQRFGARHVHYLRFMERVRAIPARSQTDGGKKVIVRIQGGLGNQLFCYAAARRLAIVNGAELVIDDVTGFIRDYRYRRAYQLHHFNIPCRLASPRERLEPLERYRRKILREYSRLLPYDRRPYLAQEGDAFDPRLLTRKVGGCVYLDGLWQSEDYFRDVSEQIRHDLEVRTPIGSDNVAIANRIATCNAVALHVRWFGAPGSSSALNTSFEYYEHALAKIEGSVENAHYFVFSDHPEEARRKLGLPDSRVTLVAHNRGDSNAWADLWLMSRCKHFIMANSTFSWWGAWLSNHPSRVVVCPRRGGIGAWNFPGQIPVDWIQL